jgi:hypothetical protein
VKGVGSMKGNKPKKCNEGDKMKSSKKRTC